MPMVRLHSAEDGIEAHLLKHMLEQQGIAAYITGEHLEGGAGELPLTGLVDVWVLEDDYEDALDVLDDFFESLDAPEDGEDDDLLDEQGYYPDDAPDEDDAPGERPAHDDPANPWNDAYRRKK